MSLLSRQQSVMIVEGNPLDSISPKSPMHGANVKTENMSSAQPISPMQLDQLVKRLSAIDKNEEIIRIVDEERTPYIFSSDNLIKLLEVTTSLKTKIAIIGLIGPRLMDPKEKTGYFTGLFRFVEDKNTVEEILKTRAQTLHSSTFSRSEGLKQRGSISGRGNATANRSGRGSGRALSISNSSSANKLTSTTSTDNFGDAHGVVSGFDNVLSALDDLGSEKPSPKTLPDSSNKGDDENVTEVSSRNSSLCSFRDNDTSSIADLKIDHDSSREINSGSPQTDTEHGSTPKRIDDDFFELPIPTATNNKTFMSMASHTAGKYRNSVQITSSSNSSSAAASLNNNKRNAEMRKLIISNPIRRSISTDHNTFSAFRRESVSAPNSPMDLAPSTPLPSSNPSSSASVGGHPNGRYGTPRRVTNEYQQLINAMTTKSPTIVTQTGSNANNLNYDLATKCAWALKLSKEDFLVLPPEPGIPQEGEIRFTYRELLRRNFAKDYGDLIQTELEKYMVEEDFKHVFQKSKSQFYNQVKWRQLEQKKRALLF